MVPNADWICSKGVASDASGHLAEKCILKIGHEKNAQRCSNTEISNITKELVRFLMNMCQLFEIVGFVQMVRQRRPWGKPICCSSHPRQNRNRTRHNWTDLAGSSQFSIHSEVKRYTKTPSFKKLSSLIITAIPTNLALQKLIQRCVTTCHHLFFGKAEYPMELFLEDLAEFLQTDPSKDTGSEII